MSVCKFKIGDRVRAINGDVWFAAGDVGTVCELPTWYGASSYMVKFDKPRHGDGRWYVAESNLEKETEQ
jgi:hypothetical protein